MGVIQELVIVLGIALGITDMLWYTQGFLRAHEPNMDHFDDGK